MSRLHPGLAALLVLFGASAGALAAEPAVSVPAPGAPRPAARAGTAPSAAASAPVAPPTASKLAEARLHFQQGVALFKDQNYDAALAEFKGAYAISAEPIVTYNVGLTYKALFRYGEAMEALERYLDESDARGHPVSKDRRAEVEKIIAELRSRDGDAQTRRCSPSD
jgi:tetratricopeptide (TPR) repeat protein